MELSTFIGGSDGYYKKGVRVTNFTLALEAIKHNEQGGMIGCQIRVQAEGKDEIEVELSVRQVNKGKWLADVPTAVWCSEEKEFYMQFRKQLAALEKDFPQVQTVVPTTGFRKVDGEWLFAFSNGALSARGFNNDICSAVKGYNFNRKEKLFEDEMERFLNLMLTKMEVLYPVFAINLLSVIRDPFADAGIDLALTLFLEGRSGAGKTTLAQVIGMFTDAETESYAGNYHKRRLVSSTEKAACVVKSLTESRGITFILDDVKREKVERQRGQIKSGVRHRAQKRLPREYYRAKLVIVAAKPRGNECDHNGRVPRNVRLPERPHGDSGYRGIYAGRGKSPCAHGISAQSDASSGSDGRIHSLACI
jgi:hypothetical protein